MLHSSSIQRHSNKSPKFASSLALDGEQQKYMYTATIPAQLPPVNATATVLRFMAAACPAHHEGCVAASKLGCTPIQAQAAKHTQRMSPAALSATKSVASSRPWNAPNVAALTASPALVSQKPRLSTFQPGTAMPAFTPSTCAMQSTTHPQRMRRYLMTWPQRLLTSHQALGCCSTSPEDTVTRLPSTLPVP